MKYIYNLFIVVLSLSFFTIIISCSKDELKLSKNTDLSIRTLTQPIVEDGMLKFNTIEDAFEYRNYLNLLLKQLRNGVETSEDYINPAIELNKRLKDTIGFVSLYDLGPKDFDGNLLEPVFPDDAFNLMLNPNYEILIGNKIFVHKNVFEYYIINKDDIANRGILRNSVPGKLFDIKYLNDGIELIGNEVEIRSPCNCKFELRRSENSSFDVHEYVLRYYCPFASDGETWKMTWTSSDGTFSETIVGTIDNSDIDYKVPHPRDIYFKVPIKVGDYKINFCVESDCNGLQEHCFEIKFSIKDECCSKLNIVKYSEVIFQNEGYKMVATYKNGTNFWGYFHYGHLAFYRLNDGAKLKAKKLKLAFNVTNRTSPEFISPCVPFSETDEDECTNCKWISENTYDNIVHKHHKRNDVRVYYEGTRGTTFGSLNILPEYCY